MIDNPLLSWINTSFIGRNIIILDEIDSTNNYAKELLQSNPQTGTVIISKIQNNGRGQQDRCWLSPKGGLYYSCILTVPTMDNLTLFTLTVGLACHDAIFLLNGLDTTLKWVNDVQYNNKKLGGILVESRIRGNITQLIVGIGINVNTEIVSLPLELQLCSTSLYNETDTFYDIFKLSALISNELEKYYELFESQQYRLLKSLWLKCSKTLGKTVIYEINDKQYKGLIIDINESGALVVQTLDGEMHSLTSNLKIIYQD